jgi:hypothetical protein
LTIQIEKRFNATAQQLWNIVGVPDRVDWVPGVTDCSWDGDVRRLNMPGAGIIAERIISIDDTAKRITYSCIESGAALEKHLASIEIIPEEQTCRMIWRTEVLPESVEPFIERSMRGCLSKIEEILGD